MECIAAVAETVLVLAPAAAVALSQLEIVFAKRGLLGSLITT